LNTPFTFEPVDEKPEKKKRKATHNLGSLPRNSMVLWLEEDGNRIPLRLYIKNGKGLDYLEFQMITKIRNKRVEKRWVLKKAMER